MLHCFYIEEHILTTYCDHLKCIKSIAQRSTLIAPLGSVRRRFRSKAKKERSSLNPHRSTFPPLTPSV
ncbi:hypothetical protein [Prevotella koreensis]|uniref:hypothetical protein n=1 Tax=Prevotella koreensis TaxID=2490854 RepID=UPI003F9F2293